jgi:hypothetical protein
MGGRFELSHDVTKSGFMWRGWLDDIPVVCASHYSNRGGRLSVSILNCAIAIQSEGTAIRSDNDSRADHCLDWGLLGFFRVHSTFGIRQHTADAIRQFTRGSISAVPDTDTNVEFLIRSVIGREGWYREIYESSLRCDETRIVNPVAFEHRMPLPIGRARINASDDHYRGGGSCGEPVRPISPAVAIGLAAVGTISCGAGLVILTLGLAGAQNGFSWRWWCAIGAIGCIGGPILVAHAYDTAFPDPNWCMSENAPAFSVLSAPQPSATAASNILGLL